MLFSTMPTGSGRSKAWCAEQETPGLPGRPGSLHARHTKLLHRETRPGGVLEGDVHFGIAAGCGRVHHGGDSVEMQPHSGPLLITKYDQCNFPSRKVLLVSDIFVGAEKHFVPVFFGLLNQLPVFQLMPANLPRICDFVASETTSYRLRGAVVEQDLHQAKVGACARLSLAKCNTAFTSSRVTSKTSVISLTDIPASRFSNTV